MWKMCLNLAFFFQWARTQCIFLMQTVGICLAWEKSAITDHHSGVTRAISTVICALYPYAEAVSLLISRL